MSGDLCLLNRQRVRPVDLNLLRRMVRHLLSGLLKVENFDMSIHLVNAAEMTHLNETRLHHAGSTDVITFDYSASVPLPSLAGEIFVCLDEALVQARRHHTIWQSELVRYIIHGVLHLQGHDDLSAIPRRQMKREERRRLLELGRDFRLSKLRRKSKVVT